MKQHAAGTCRKRPFRMAQEICSIFVGCWLQKYPTSTGSDRVEFFYVGPIANLLSASYYLHRMLAAVETIYFTGFP